MDRRSVVIGALLIFLGVSTVSAAAENAGGPSAFHPGPVFEEFGRIATVASDMPIPEGTRFKVRFDVAAGAKPGTINRGFDTVARFINMHVEAGVPLEALDVAVVIHGAATLDVLTDEAYASRREGESANSALVAALVSHGVRFYQCGQSAAFQGVSNDDLQDGVTMALSAMTAHALLDQQGYSLNPF